MKFSPQFKKVPYTFCGVPLFVQQWSIKYAREFEAKAAECNGRFDLTTLGIYLKNSLFDADGTMIDLENWDEFAIDDITALMEVVIEVNGLNRKPDTDKEVEKKETNGNSESNLQGNSAEQLPS